MASGDATPGSFDPPLITWDGERQILAYTGDWSWQGFSQRVPALPRTETGAVTVDTSAMQRLDTAGAVTLRRHLESLESRGHAVDRARIQPAHRELLDMVTEHRLPPSPTAPRPGIVYRIGEASVDGVRRLAAFFAFVGEVSADSVPRLLHPHTLRWRQVVGEMDNAGVRALPILGLLVFLTGVVIAFQGGQALQQYGATIFLVDLLTLTMLREMAPLMTAIIVAGRTGSAFTAQIGTMRITEEVDALRVIGVTPYEMLVLPKILALVIVMPLLTIFADIFGMLGGMTVATAYFDIGVREFIQRVPEAVAASSFWVGIIKAPVFAVIIALVACYHGFHVQNSTESVGRATTQSVVQGIFLVIVADAAFSVVFSQLNL